MLTDRITLAPTAELEPEDIFFSSLSVIFPDDITNQHGDPSTPVIYTSPTYGKILLSLADPIGEDSRRLFAQYLWNAGVYVAVEIEDVIVGTAQDERHTGQEEETNTSRDKRTELHGNEIYPIAELNLPTKEDTSPPPMAAATIVSHSTKSPWNVQNESVLELGAGTGLAGIIATKAGAHHVLIMDYPAPEVLANLEANLAQNLSPEERSRCRVQGHEWGAVPSAEGGGDGCDGGDGEEENTNNDRDNDDDDDNDNDNDNDNEIHHQHQHEQFTRILVADCLWMPSQHGNLHRSIAHYLSPSSGSYALVVAGFHTGRAKMAPFFDERALAAAGLCLESIVERDAVGRERDWTRIGGGGGGGGGDGVVTPGGGGHGGKGDAEGGGGGGRGGAGGRLEDRSDGEGRSGASERKRWLVVAVLKKL